MLGQARRRVEASPSRGAAGKASPPHLDMSPCGRGCADAPREIREEALVRIGNSSGQTSRDDYMSGEEGVADFIPDALQKRDP